LCVVNEGRVCDEERHVWVSSWNTLCLVVGNAMSGAPGRGERVWFAGRGADERVLVSCKHAIVLVPSHTERVFAFAFALRVAVFTWQ